WPATMEGAVRSGYRTSEGILEDLGRPLPLVQPDLPASALASWLIPDVVEKPKPSGQGTSRPRGGVAGIPGG
ncbi:hypothetical protein ACYOEI_36465, partial [Singulisphaera rosea]